MTVSDWTVDPTTCRSNSSPRYLEIVAAVEQIIRDGAHTLLAGHAGTTASVIVAQLAHKHGLVPGPLPPEQAVEAERERILGLLEYAAKAQEGIGNTVQAQTLRSFAEVFVR